MGSRWLLLLIIAIFVGVNSQTDKKVYCGRQLSMTLSAVCKGNYNTLTKKSAVYQKKSFWDAQYYSSDDPGAYEASYPFRSKASATTLMTQFRRRRKRGVYNECCEKACSYEELMTYCAPGSRRRR